MKIIKLTFLHSRFSITLLMAIAAAPMWAQQTQSDKASRPRLHRCCLLFISGVRLVDTPIHLLESKYAPLAFMSLL